MYYLACRVIAADGEVLVCFTLSRDVSTRAGEESFVYQGVSITVGELFIVELRMCEFEELGSLCRECPESCVYCRPGGTIRAPSSL
jgi:hypothetical protein